MEQDMRSDVELLNTLCDEAPLVVDRVTGRSVVLSKKVIALWTGRAVQTVSDYATGKLNIPIEFWRRILEHHFDPRIPNLLFPEDYDHQAIAPWRAEPANARQFFRQAVQESGAHHAKQTYIADILADGRIDELDASTVQDYADAYVHHRALDCQLHRAILQAFNRAMAARKVAR